MMENRWRYVLVFVALVSLLAGGVCESRMLISARGAERSGWEIWESLYEEWESEKGETEQETMETSQETGETDGEETETEDMAEPLKAELKVGNSTVKTGDYYRDDVSLLAEITGGTQPWQDIKWHISCQTAETGEALEMEEKLEPEHEKKSDEASGEIGTVLELILTEEGSYEVYLSVTDMDGTTVESNRCRFIIDRTAPAVSVTEITEAMGGKGIYGSREIPRLAISAEELYGEDVTAGLDRVLYRIADSSGGTIEGCLMERSDGENAAGWQGHLKVNPADFADGRLEITVTASDRAGNTGCSETVILETDTRTPVVSFRFDSSDQWGEYYFSHNKVLIISVEEKNFDLSCLPVVMTDNQNGYSFSGWQQIGERTEGIIIFSGDGEYAVSFSCTDLAGNRSDTEMLPGFIIDETAPLISVSYDDQPVSNEKYYGEGRTAVITVEEHNFREGDGRISISCGEGEEIPVVGPWTSDGSRHQVTVVFETDGRYSLSVEWMDPAGNKAREYHSEPFIIDRTAPELIIEEVEDHSSYNGKVTPKIRFSDANISVDGISLSMNEAYAGTVDISSMIRTMPEVQGGSIIFNDFGPGMDGIYTLRASAEDLAGNQTVREIRFTVNRGGSTYAFSDETSEIFEQIFIREPEDIVIYENNLDWLTYSEISVSCGGEITELSEGRDYRINAVGAEDRRKHYTYTIPAEFFKKEGTYVIHIYSQDRASNLSSNDMAKERAEFILDSTGPLITVANLEERHYYHEKEHEFTAIISDNTILESVSYFLNDQLMAAYNRDELEQMGGVLYLKTGTSDDYQTIRLEAVDVAGNMSKSEEWHVLVNASQQTVLRSGWGSQEEENEYQGSVLAVLTGTAVVIGIMGAAWFLKKKR